MVSDHRTAGYKTKLNYKDERKQLFHRKKYTEIRGQKTNTYLTWRLKTDFLQWRKRMTEKFIFKLNNRDQTGRRKNVNANGIIKKGKKNKIRNYQRSE